MLPHLAGHAMLGSIESASMHVPVPSHDPREGASQHTRVDGEPSIGTRSLCWTAAM